jgi:DMSO/TMAO reductase YedYZ molybdopterin-dependent catalytic subunit
MSTGGPNLDLKGRGALLGLLSTVAGLSAGQLMAALNRNWHTPIVSIGNRVIDRVPSAVKQFAIRTFGVNDKTFLVATILVVVLGISVFIGRSFVQGKVGVSVGAIIAMTAVAGLAALMDANADPFSFLPSMTSGVTTILVLRWLRDRENGSELSGVELSRRELFKAAGIIGAASIAATGMGRILHQRASVKLERLKIALPKPLKFLAKPPVDPARSMPGLSPLFTPNETFYRIDTALSIPNISVESWRLRIDGMVGKPRTFTYAELTSRPVFELDDTIACVSNAVGGNLIGNARWLGIRLDDLIREVSPSARADQVMGYSSDGFSAGFPLAALDGRDAMIAIGMNGEPLPLEHGFPARIIVPGLYGYVSATKWLTHIEITRFDKKQGYWIPRGWSAQAPIKTQSRIDTPLNGTSIKSGIQAIAGVAWAPTRGISKVEVRVGSDPWRPATLGPELAKTTWRQWWIDWSATPGNYQIFVRATDGNGVVQSKIETPVEPNGAEGWHTIFVRVKDHL